MPNITPAERYLEIVLICKNKKKSISDQFDPNKGLTDDEILMRVKECEQSILNYCQIPGIPPQLNYVWANMAVDLIMFEIENNYTPEDPMEGLDVSDLSSIKVGDTSIFVGDKYRSNWRSRTLQSHNANLDDIVMNYRQQLNQFRRIL